MPNYVDGFVLPLAKDKIDIYTSIAEKAKTVWLEHGALDYREAVLEDPDAKDMVNFPALANAKEGDTVVFAYIVFESRAHRDEVNAKVMADPRLHEMCPEHGGQPPFDCKTMAYGGFRTIVGD